MLDAYTVKKMMPRLLLAAVLVNLSWVICIFLLDTSNVLGGAVKEIISTPFNGLETDILETWSTVSQVTSFGVTTLLVGATTLFGSWAILTPTLLVALFGLITAYFVVVLRQVLIIFLIILSPIAIVLWVIPGTENWAKKWFSVYIKLLLMYPLIIAFLLSGKIASAIILEVADGAKGVEDVVLRVAAIFALFAPYFLIPLTFKFVGGAIASIGGFFNDRSRGVIDSSRKWASQKGAENRSRIATGNRFRTGNKDGFVARANRGLQLARFAPQAGLRPRNMRANINTAIGSVSNVEMQKMLQEDQDYATWKGDDDLNRAASESHDEASLREALIAQDNRRVNRGQARKWGTPDEMDSAVSRVQRVRKKMGEDSFRRMTTHQALAGGTAYDTAGEAWEAVARAGGNDAAATQSLVAAGRGALMNAGRVDQGGAGFGATYNQVLAMQDELRRTGTVSDATRNSVNDAIHQGVYQSQGGATLVHSSMKRSAIEQIAPTVVNSVRDTMATGTEQEQMQSLASLANVYDGLQGSSPEKARVFADNVMGQAVPTSNLPLAVQRAMGEQVVTRDASGTVTGVTYTNIPATATVSQIVRASRGNDAFQEMRREYQSETAVGPQSSGGPGGPPTTPPTTAPTGSP